MTEPHQRLKEARAKAGYSSAKIAAETFGWAVSSYIQHENGTRGIPKDKAPLYAKRFRTTPEWLLYGQGDAPIDSPIPTEDQLAAMLEEAQREVPANATYGDWPRIVASTLRAQLARFQESGLAGGDPIERRAPAPGKAARSRPATKPAAQA